jgi:hypothetical protein
MYRKLISAERRPFQITIGLMEGYGESVVEHELNEVILVLGRWQRNRLERGQRFFSGHVVDSRLVYSWLVPNMGAQSLFERGAIILGEINPLRDGDMSDEQVIDMIDQAAVYIGGMLKQTRVYVSFKDKMWILQDDELKKNDARDQVPAKK